jgi:hypothetical protein
MEQVHRFLNLEAQQEDNKEETTDDEEQDPFVVPDGMIEDGPVTLSRALDYRHIYQMPSTAGPSHYTQVVDAIAEHFEDSMGDRSEDLISDDEDTIVLDTTGIWEMIRDWITVTLLYERLMRHIDFQYGKYPKIQYWEDFVSDLAFNGVDEQQALFRPIVLDEHRHRLAHYVYLVVPHPTSAPPPLPSVSPASPPSQDETVTKMWFVRIIPGKCISEPSTIFSLFPQLPLHHTSLQCGIRPVSLPPSTSCSGDASLSPRRIHPHSSMCFPHLTHPLCIPTHWCPQKNMSVCSALQHTNLKYLVGTKF